MTNPTNTRTANHVAITDSGKAHYAADTFRDGRFIGHTLACNGRTMDAAGISFEHSPVVTCVACTKAHAGGRIVVTV